MWTDVWPAKSERGVWLVKRNMARGFEMFLAVTWPSGTMVGNGMFLHEKEWDPGTYQFSPKLADNMEEAEEKLLTLFSGT